MRTPNRIRSRATALAGACAIVGGVAALPISPASADAAPVTPIKHLVVLFDENVSFDHYFGTYPSAANTADETLQGSGDQAPRFEAAPGSPTPNTFSRAGLAGEANPNQYKPFRFTPGQAVTCDQDHAYDAEQKAMNGGKMDQFVQYTTKDKCASAGPNMYDHPGEVMGYYDGNTVTGLWNYAQNYTLNDNYWTTQFGPSTPGALNLIAGNTFGAQSYDPNTEKKTAAPAVVGATATAGGPGTIFDDADPIYDDCSNKNHTGADAVIGMSGKNIGDLLNGRGVSWGWFQGGFRPSTASSDGSVAQCNYTHTNVAGNASIDYSPHHNPFAYYESTANRHHLAPANADEIGHNGRANHNYDLTDFDTALGAGNLPAVSFVKASEYQDGHAGYSDPLDEQTFLTTQINKIQQSADWDSTAIVIAYDDSDGWYDHQLPTILSGSKDPKLDSAVCSGAAAAPLGGNQLRCGPGTRQPLLVVSPFARKNHVDSTPIEQASILKFVEDNWRTGRIEGSADERAGSLQPLFDFAAPRTDKLWLDQVTGAPRDTSPPASEGAQQASITNGATPSTPTAAKHGSSVNWAAIVIPTVVVVVLIALGVWLLRGRRRASGGQS